MYFNTRLLVKTLNKIQRNLFLKNKVLNKNPCSIFTNWYKTANQICNADSMYLTTVSKTCIPSCRVTTCLEFSRDGFIFPVTEGSQACTDLVRIEGIAKLSEASEAYCHKLPYNSKILTACRKFQSSFENRQTLLKCLHNIKDKYPANSNVLCSVFVFILKPSRIEFFQSKNGQLQERLQFDKNMEIDNKLIYEAEDGWTYSILSP